MEVAMTPEQRVEENEAAYWRLKPMIDQKYPKGWFVAVADGRVVADAATFEELYAGLKATGWNPREVLAVEAGVEYPRYADIIGLSIQIEDERQA
jgi:hypothetical protein